MLFMAKLRQKKGWNIGDGDAVGIVDSDQDGNNITEEFYRVASVLSFKPSDYRETNKPATALYFAENDKIRYIEVKLPMRAVEEIAKSFHRMGTPFYQQLIDLRPDKQEQLAEDYKNKSGDFAYLKQLKNVIS